MNPMAHVKDTSFPNRLVTQQIKCQSKISISCTAAVCKFQKDMLLLHKTAPIIIQKMFDQTLFQSGSVVKFWNGIQTCTSNSLFGKMCKASHVFMHTKRVIVHWESCTTPFFLPSAFKSHEVIFDTLWNVDHHVRVELCLRHSYVDNKL